MPPQASSELQLIRGNSLLGTIKHNPEKDDWPWQHGSFTAADGFASVKHLFEKELLFMRERRYQEFDEVWDEIEAIGLRMRAIETAETFSVGLIHIENGKAWWRTMRHITEPELTA
jgi:hypothetical protein